jgi:hypothetical protein
MISAKKLFMRILFILFSGVAVLGIFLFQSSGTGSVKAAAPDASPTYGWNSFMVGFRAVNNQKAGGVLNTDYTNSKSELLTQYVLNNPQYDGISSNGKQLLYQETMNGRTQYYTIGPRFSYEQKGQGNAIWMSDSRHVLILNQNKGVTEVDTVTGKTQNVLSLPYKDPRGAFLDIIQKLVFTNSGFLYFVGSGGGECMGALCRIQLNPNHANIGRLSGRQTGTTFWLSPDGKTVYYRNMGPAGVAGIYAVNTDGTHMRIVRYSDPTYNSGVPIGFAADNSLVIMRNVAGKFQVVKLGATSKQDRILAANAAPGAVSLCDPSYKGSGITICDQNIALAPYSHAVVVQGTLSKNQRVLWSTNLITGKQVRIHFVDFKDGVAVELLGWDKLPVCASDRC